MTEQINSEPKNTIRELTLDELKAVSGGDGGGAPCPPAPNCGEPYPQPLPPVAGVPC
jgi:hypothetical protein